MSSTVAVRIIVAPWLRPAPDISLLWSAKGLSNTARLRESHLSASSLASNSPNFFAFIALLSCASFSLSASSFAFSFPDAMSLLFFSIFISNSLFWISICLSFMSTLYPVTASLLSSAVCLSASANSNWAVFLSPAAIASRPFIVPPANAIAPLSPALTPLRPFFPDIFPAARPTPASMSMSFHPPIFFPGAVLLLTRFALSATGIDLMLAMSGRCGTPVKTGAIFVDGSRFMATGSWFMPDALWRLEKSASSWAFNLCPLFFLCM